MTSDADTPVSEDARDPVQEAIERFLDLQSQGKQPDTESFLKRYPGLEQKLSERLADLSKIETLFESVVQMEDEVAIPSTVHEIQVGQQIGDFRVTEVAGRGGMGVVYKALDTKLDREVAVKALPAEFLADATARSRLRREARALASLNHPNIATLFDLLEQEERRDFLIMEYVPGTTLSEVMSQRRLDLDETLSIARGIAEGLAAAYGQGMTHRDLKPANVKITPQGQVKILDFGIAKPMRQSDPAADSLVTQAGRIVGTPAYMSPEQARGKSIDHRSDIWSFGCVLYEMLVGEMAFPGETVSDTIAQVLQSEPNWQKLPERMPANLKVLLRRCLEKDTHRRLQHIGDAVIELNETLNAPSVAPPSSQYEMSLQEGRSWGTNALFGLGGFLMGLLFMGFGLRGFLSNNQTRIEYSAGHRLAITLPEGLSLAMSRSTPLGWAQPAISLSQDGTRLVYVAESDETTALFLRPLDSFAATRIAGTEGAFFPFFSPDGQSIGFFTEDKLKKVSLLGGAPVTLCDATNPRGADWAEDGMIYFADVQGQTLQKIPAAGGDKLPIGSTDAKPVGRRYDYPQLLPGGEWILCSPGEIRIVSQESSETKLVSPRGDNARYLASGQIVFAAAGALMIAQFDLKSLNLSGPAVPVSDGVLHDSSRGTMQFDLSTTGTLAYVPGGDTAQSVPVLVDGKGVLTPLPFPAQTYGMLNLSPDGRQLVVPVQAGSMVDTFLYELETGRPIRLTTQEDFALSCWLFDRQRSTYSLTLGRWGQDSQKMEWIPADGQGKAGPLPSRPSYQSSPWTWSPDGILAFVLVDPNTGGDIWVTPWDGSRRPERIIASEAYEWGACFSPDGKWLAYVSDRDAKFQVYVQPYPDLDTIEQVSRGFGEEPKWSPTNNELFYRNGDQWMVVTYETEPVFKASPPRVFVEGPFKNVPAYSFEVMPNGEQLLVLQPEHDESNKREIRVVPNWLEAVDTVVSMQ